MDFKTHGIALEAEATDCVIEIYLNGIPVGLCGIGGNRSLNRPIYEFLLDGENEIGVLVNPGDTPATAMHFSRQSKPAFGAQPPPDPAMDAFIEARQTEEREERRAKAAKEKKNTAEDLENIDGEDISEDENGEEISENNTADNENKDNNGGDETGENEKNEPEEESEPSTLSFIVKLSLYEVGVIAGGDDSETLMSIEWSAADSAEILQSKNPVFPLAEENAVGAQIYPIWLTKKDDLGKMFGAPHWLDAKPQTLDEKTVSNVTDFVDRIRDLIEEGDAAPILEISTAMYREVAAAYDISAEERANMFRQFLQQQSEKPYWMFETPEPEDYSFRLCAGNRLIECVGADWRPIIRGVPSPQGRFLYPMLIGKLNGDWIIMR